MHVDALSVLRAQLTRDLLAIAKFLLHGVRHFSLQTPPCANLHRVSKKHVTTFSTIELSVYNNFGTHIAKSIGIDRCLYFPTIYLLKRIRKTGTIMSGNHAAVQTAFGA